MDDRFGLVGYCLADKYDIETVVARGGFGLVYQAVHTTLNRRVAIKVLMVPEELNDAARADFMQMFLQEAQMIAQLDHPAIVRVLDSGVGWMPNDEQAPWMALDWIDGQTLSAHLKSRKGQGGRSPAEALGLLRPVLEAIAYAHELGVAHRDIKPANMMLPTPVAGRPTRYGTAGLRLMDFGIAKLMSSDETAGGGHTRTRSRNMAYSPWWAAPEQIGGSRTGPWTDVHALGLILSQVVTDQAPFTARDQTELFSLVLNSQRPTPASLGVDVGAWEPVLAKALALRPAERYGTAGEFLAALEEALPGALHRSTLGSTVPGGGFPVPVRAPPATASTAPPVTESSTLRPAEVSKMVPAPPPSSGRTLWVVGAAAVLVVAALCVGAWAGLHAPETPHAAGTASPAVTASPVHATPPRLPPPPAPVVAQPVVAQPVVAQPVVAQPVVAQPVVAQPVVAQPVVAQPVVAQPVVAQPVAPTAQVLAPAVHPAASAVPVHGAPTEPAPNPFGLPVDPATGHRGHVGHGSPGSARPGSPGSPGNGTSPAVPGAGRVSIDDM